jgi:hypothetical protein
MYSRICKDLQDIGHGLFDFEHTSYMFNSYFLHIFQQIFTGHFRSSSIIKMIILDKETNKPECQSRYPRPVR